MHDFLGGAVHDVTFRKELKDDQRSRGRFVLHSFASQKNAKMASWTFGDKGATALQQEALNKVKNLCSL